MSNTNTRSIVSGVSKAFNIFHGIRFFAVKPVAEKTEYCYENLAYPEIFKDEDAFISLSDSVNCDIFKETLN